MAVVDLPAKTFDEDASNEICFRWEKDGSERREKDGSERCETDGSPVTEMLAEPAPVEIGDARSIRKSIRLSVDIQEPVSPTEAQQSETSVIERDSVVSPLSPHSPHWQSLS